METINLINVLISFISIGSAFMISYLILKHKLSRSYEDDYVRAYVYYQNHDYDKAIFHFIEVIKNLRKTNPMMISALIGMFNCYVAIEKHKEAREILDKATKLAYQYNNKLLETQISKLNAEYENAQKQ